MTDNSSSLDDFQDGAADSVLGYDETSDPLFDDVDEEVPQIFKRRELLEVGHVPKKNRIVGRDDEIEDVGGQLRPVVRNSAPSSFIIYGKTGTGKSLVTQHVAARAKRAAERRGTRVGVVYVDCSQHSTETQAACKVARDLNDEAETGISVPRSGLGAGHYYSYAWEILDDLYDAAVVILDEIDRLDDGRNDDNILMQLSRAREAGKTDVNIGIVAISNKISYRDQLNERVKSSLGDDEFVFPPYDATQLKQIMQAREDAFHEGVLDPDVIPKAAALAAREHGDARKAIRILRNAGEIAEREGDDRVHEFHVDAAQKRAEVDRLEELLSGSTPHTKHVLLALAYLTKQRDGDEFRTTVIYETYERICEEEGSDPLGLDRIRDLLKEQAFLEIIESYHTGGGRGRGSYTVHQLLKNPDVVFRCVRGTTVEV